MILHLVNGFLGAGKTTAIITAARQYIAQGKKVGVVTNDKGRHLVDTAFFRGEEIPTEELPGGCFRCNFDEFKKRIASLDTSAAPDIIFAESVGSCVDLVNTVFSPLQTVSGLDIDQITYSVFVDIRLFAVWLEDKSSLPFSEAVLYTFRKQVEEASVVILNKIDLLSPEDVERTRQTAQRQYPGKSFLLQNSLEASGILDWMRNLEAAPLSTSTPGFQVDYNLYNLSEQMAWIDRIFVIKAQDPGQARDTAIRLIHQIMESIRGQQIAVAHVKFHLSDAARGVKISFATMDEHQASMSDTLEQEIPAEIVPPLNLMMNARVEADAARCRYLVREALASIRESCEAEIQVVKGRSYNPRVEPSPFDP